MTTPQTQAEISDAERLRRLAGWFEYVILNQGTNPDGFDHYPSVPVAPDLRRIADVLDARASADAEIERLQEAIEAEWYNGNMSAGAYERIKGPSHD